MLGALFAGDSDPLAVAAQSPKDSGLLLTVVARHCPEYTDISPNLARNNIMESLRDLRKGDSPYKSGELMDVGIEAKEQPKCDPLPDWTFTLGDSYQTKAKVGPWGALSIVFNPFKTNLTTKDETAQLNPEGLDTGRTIKGAVTIRLSDAEAKLAATGALWIQGGTPEDPILNKRFPGPKYGFGALRCAVDDLNGDNVEYIAYPDGVTHVFCFAYYVLPPPTSGTIVIRKEVRGAPPGLDETFGFDGNTSFEPGGRFDLHVTEKSPSAQFKVYRGATTSQNPWTIHELGIATWRLDDLSCISRDGTTTFLISQPDAEAKIALGAGDLATCTYTNAYDPPPQGGLDIRKVTLGGTGHFTYEVRPAGGGDASHAEVTTTEEGLATDAIPITLPLHGGDYEIDEQMSHSDEGRWKLESVDCDGEQKPAELPVTVSVPEQGLRTCTFTNRFIPRGSIEITKITKGGHGNSSFVIYQGAGELAEYHLSADTKAVDEPVAASGDPTDNLELGDYKIIDFPPAPKDGEWSLAYVQCDGKAVPFAQGQIDIELTAKDPHRHCTFVNSFDPTPPPDPEKPQPPSPLADLVVQKDSTVHSPRVGQVVNYELSVRNRGKSRASSVRLIDQPLGGGVSLISAIAKAGSCRQRLPVVCRLGGLRKGQRKTVQVQLQVWKPGPLVNQAVSGTKTETKVVRRGRAQDRIRVKAVHRRHGPAPSGLG